MKLTIAELNKKYPDFEITFSMVRGHRNYGILHKPTQAHSCCNIGNKLEAVERLIREFDATKAPFNFDHSYWETPEMQQRDRENWYAYVEREYGKEKADERRAYDKESDEWLERVKRDTE